jgi:hypothetical protein
MPKRSKVILEVWNGSAWVPVYRRSSGDENAIINLQIKEKLGHPVMARFSLINRPVTTSAVRGYVEQTYGAYLDEFDRIRLVESFTKAIIFYGRVYRQEVKQDMSYGSLINITAFDALQELRENVLQGQEANLTSTTTVSSAITKIINAFSYNTRVGSDLVSSNISVADTQKFNTSASSTADNPNFSSGNETALTAIYKLAAKDPHSATASDTEPDTDFGYNYFVDSGFTSADAATTHANAKPAFNYFKRETIPTISPVNYYNITYKGIASDGDSSNSYVTTTNTFADFDFSKQYTDIVTHALITYSKDDGTQDTLTAIKLNAAGISNGAGGNIAFGTLLDGISIPASPKLWRRETSADSYENVGRLIYLDSVSGTGVAIVALNSDISVYDVLESTLSAGVYDDYLYVLPDGTTPSTTATNRFEVTSGGSSASELIRQKEFNYDGVEKADDVRRAIAAHFTKKTESTKPVRGLVQIPEYPMARITVDPSSINTGTNVLTLPINVLYRGVRKGMLVRQVTSAGVETGNYGYISNVTTSPDTITVQLYDSGNSTTSWSSDDKCLIFIPIRPGFRVNVTNTLANISGTGVVLDIDYSEGVGVQTASMNIVINNTAAIYSDTPYPTHTGASNTATPPTATKAGLAQVNCDFTNTGSNQVNWAAGTFYLGTNQYAISAGNQGSLSTSTWSIVYWLSSDDGGNDAIFSTQTSVAAVPAKAIKVARIKAGNTKAEWEFFIPSTDNPQYDLGDTNVFTGDLGVDLFADGAKPFTTDVTWSGGTGANYNQVTNDSGTLNYADGTTLSVTGKTHVGLDDSSNQYFYVDTTSGTVSDTTSGSAAIASNKILLAIAGISNSVDQDTPTILPINTKTPIISATAIAANSITADKIQANAIQADKLETNLTISNTIRTASSGARVEITSSGLKILHTPGSTTESHFTFTDTSGDFFGMLKAQSYVYTGSSTQNTLAIYGPGASSHTKYQLANFGYEIGTTQDAEMVLQGSLELKDTGEGDDPSEIFWVDSSKAVQGSIYVNGSKLLVKNSALAVRQRALLMENDTLLTDYWAFEVAQDSGGTYRKHMYPSNSTADGTVGDSYNYIGSYDNSGTWSLRPLSGVFSFYHYFGAGSAANPALAFYNDGTGSTDYDTGIYSGGANILAFSTAGTARWTIGTGGDLVPATDGSGGSGFDIGSSSYEVDKFYGYTIFFSNSASTTGTDLIVTASGQIAKKSSSIQYKENVKNLVFDSSKLDILRPVSYDYKLNNAPDIGLVAEEVDEVFPELVNYDKEGKPESVKYHSLSVMLLDEVTKLRKEVKELKENN